jgi:hypothetical protein
VLPLLPGIEGRKEHRKEGYVDDGCRIDDLACRSNDKQMHDNLCSAYWLMHHVVSLNEHDIIIYLTISFIHVNCALSCLCSKSPSTGSGGSLTSSHR